MIRSVEDSAEQMTNKVKNAVIDALTEEMQPKGRTYIWASLKAFGLAAILSGLIYACWFTHFDSRWMASCIVIWVFLTITFIIYAYPQVRLSIRGYWSLSRIAIFFGAMTVVTALQLILCPHFALVHLASDSPFRFFEGITNFYMSLGGMKLCMFLCGATFASIGTLVAALPIAKQLAFSRFRYLCMIILLGLAAQVPIAILQLSDEGMRSFFGFWISGSSLGIGLVILVTKWIHENWIR